MTQALAVIYARISDDKTGEHLGVARQQADCLALAASRGLNVSERPYVDNDLSAFSGKRRPAYEQLITDVQSGSVGTVLVYMTSRLWRNRRERAVGSDLFMRHGVRVLPVRGPELDFSSAAGRLVANILGEMDTHESDVKSERQVRKALELAQAGKVSGGGDRPFGYQRIFEEYGEPHPVTGRRRRRIVEERLDPVEAEIIREMSRRVLAGEGIRGVANDLNERGITTTRGKQWSSYTTRRLLMSARIAGQREHHGEIVADAVWPGIISKADSARLRALLGDPSRRTSYSTARYLLTGLLRCSYCKKGLVGRPREDKVPRYVCNATPGSGGCGKTFTMAGPVEEYVTDLVLTALDGPALLEALRGAEEQVDGEALHLELVEVQQELEALADDHGHRRISRREWLVAREPLQRAKEDLERRLTAGRPSSALTAADLQERGVRAAWPDLSRDRRRAVLDAVLDRVVVHPGRRGYNGFDPDRFELIWRV